ncbi:MAG: peptidylprolyl isomerase [Sphingomicrobium sp.]
MKTIIAVLPLLIAAAEPAKQLTPPDIVAAAPAKAWRAIPADDLLVMDLKDGGRIVIQLAPRFAPVHVANLRALAKGGWWDGAAIYRVQDNYVAQWGNNDNGKVLPAGVAAKPPAEYSRSLKGLAIKPLGSPDPYAPAAGFADGWPVAYSPKGGWANLAHCYAMVGVGRDLSPDTGTGGELYAIIGHATRQLDRNIALVGRVVEGIDRLSSLPRGTEALGFYKERSEDRPISRVTLASQLPGADQPRFEYLDSASASFAAYLQLRANRHDAFYDHPAGGVDLCNVAPPVRRTP